jgi:sulfhydrogenase subunit delta
MECKRRVTVCVLVAKQIPCLGPVTQAGCNALCPSYSRGCFGCYGPSDSPNTESMAAIFEKLSVRSDDIVRSFRGFNAGAEAFRKVSEAYEKQND